MASKEDEKLRYTTELLKIPGLGFDARIKDPKERLEAYINAYRSQHPTGKQSFEDVLMRDHLKIIDATVEPGKATTSFEMRASPEFTSRMGNMHGGSVALILDMCTTMCVAPLLPSNNGFVFDGVSRTLSITYLRPIREMTDMLIECEILQRGKRLTTIRGQIKDKKDGRLLAVAEHNKASIELVTEKAKI